MDESKTLSELHNAASTIFKTVPKLRRIGKESEHVYQARMDRLAEMLMDVVVGMTDMIVDLEKAEAEDGEQNSKHPSEND